MKSAFRMRYSRAPVGLDPLDMRVNSALTQAWHSKPKADEVPVEE